jgi:hypothetical protein
MPTLQEQLDTLNKGIAAVEAVKGNYEQLKKLVEDTIVPTMVKLQTDIQVASNRGTSDDARSAEIERAYTVSRDAKIVAQVSRMEDVSRVVKLYGPDSIVDDTPKNAWQEGVQRAHDRIVFARAMSRRPRPNVEARLLAMFLGHLKDGPGAIGKAFADVSALGAEWIPDTMSAMFVQDVRNESLVASQFQVITMADKNVAIPWGGFGLTPYLKGGTSDNNPAQYRATEVPTTQRTLVAKSLAIRNVVDDDANDDSIVAFLDLAMRDHVRALADGWDDGIINGQTGTAMDTLTGYNPQSRWATAGLGTSVDHRKVFDGLRKRILDTLSSATDNSGTITAGLILTARGKLSNGHAGRGRDLRAFVSVKALLKLMATTQVETMEKIGADATIIKGDLMKIYGIPIIVTDFLADNYEATGKYTAGSGGKGMIVLANVSRFLIGSRKGQAIETARDITRGVTEVVSTVRGDFISVDGTTSNNAAGLINLTV